MPYFPPVGYTRKLSYIFPLMPGRYDITKRVGQLVIAEVKHFILKSSIADQNVTFSCHSNATLGLTVVESFNVTVSDLQIIHCSAMLIHISLIEEMLRYTERRKLM